MLKNKTWQRLGPHPCSLIINLRELRLLVLGRAWAFLAPSPPGSQLLLSINCLAPETSEFVTLCSKCRHPDVPKALQTQCFLYAPCLPSRTMTVHCSIFPSLVLFIPHGLLPMEGTRKPEPLSHIQTLKLWQALAFWIRTANLRFFPPLRTNYISQTHGHWKKAYKHFPFTPLAPSNVELRFFFFSWIHKLDSSPCSLIYSMLTLGFF